MKWLREFVGMVVRWRMLLASGAFIVLASFLFTHVLMGNNGLISYRQKKAEYQKLQQVLKRIGEENQHLDAEIKALKSDPKAVEKEAREQLRYAKPGEVIVLLPEAQGPHPAAAPQPAESARR